MSFILEKGKELAHSKGKKGTKGKAPKKAAKKPSKKKSHSEDDDEIDEEMDEVNCKFLLFSQSFFIG